MTFKFSFLPNLSKEQVAKLLSADLDNIKVHRTSSGRSLQFLKAPSIFAKLRWRLRHVHYEARANWMTEFCLCEVAIRPPPPSPLLLYSLSIDCRIILLRFLGGKMSVSRGGIARSRARSGDDTGLSGLLHGGVSKGSRSTLTISTLYSCL